jgi:DedD protein
MAKSISEEELQLRKRARRRLIGAIALAMVAAVVLPMVLDSEPKPLNQNVNITIPSPDSGAFSSKVVPVTPPPANSAKDISPARTPSAAPPVESSTATGAADSKAPSVAKGAEAGAPAAAPKAAPAEKAPGTPSKAQSAAKPETGAFIIQVSALSDASKAKQMHASIAAAGVKSYTQVVKTAKGDVTRVRAGPFSSRAEAERARDKLKAIGLSGNIAPK